MSVHLVYSSKAAAELITKTTSGLFVHSPLTRFYYNGNNRRILIKNIHSELPFKDTQQSCVANVIAYGCQLYFGDIKYIWAHNICLRCN